jgi:triosephosphate isomerase
MRQLLAGNWKMHGLHTALGEIRALNRVFGKAAPPATILICPPATLIAQAAKEAEGGPIAIGGQDCHAQASGAFTGDVSAEMLRDAGATWVILGHSERRQYHGETDAVVADKARAAKRAGLTAILCVGESEKERVAGLALDVVSAQVKSCVPPEFTASDFAIAYEPVWAIGTGRTPKAPEIAEMHAKIRTLLETRFSGDSSAIRILYGGSVKPENAAEILSIPDVDGALIGGASLKAGDLLAITKSAPSR